MIRSDPFRPAAEITSTYSEEELWLVPGIIPVNGLVVLASAPKTGKTCFATALARAVAKGEDFLGQKVQQSPVLWCSHEETPPERILLHEGLTVEDPLLIAYPTQLAPLTCRLPKTDFFGRRDFYDGFPPFMFDHAQRVKARLIVVDCLHAAVEGVSLADNSVARAIMMTLRLWASQSNTAVLVLHHLTKSSTRNNQPERFADSNQILASATCHFFMDRYEESPARSRVILHGKGRHPSPVARLELVSEGILDYKLADKNDKWVEVKKLTNADKILNLLEEGWNLTAEEIARRLELNLPTVRVVLVDLQKRGCIASSRKRKEVSRYSLAEPS